MQLDSLQHRVQASQLPLERLAGNAQLDQKEKIAEVSRQFEAVLLRQILGEAQKPVFKSKMTDSSLAGDVYRDMLTTQMADQISRSGSIGLAHSLSSQLQHQLKPGQKAGGPGGTDATAASMEHPLKRPPIKKYDSKA